MQSALYMITVEKRFSAETINTSFTYLKKGTELFKVVNAPMQDSMEQYVTPAKQTEESQTAFILAN